MKVTEIIKSKLDCGALERSCGPYHNLWVLVPKKAGRYKLINAAQRLNAITIKDASLPPSADNFSEGFVGFPLLSLSDLFSRYDQYILTPESRDMTAFMTPFGLLRMTTLPQGYTNSVQVFDEVIYKVLKDVISEHRGRPFIDDVAVKPILRSYYLDDKREPEEVALGIRRYVQEGLIFLDKVLVDIERSGATISGEKSEFLKESQKVVTRCRECGGMGHLTWRCPKVRCYRCDGLRHRSYSCKGTFLGKDRGSEEFVPASKLTETFRIEEARDGSKGKRPAESA